MADGLAIFDVDGTLADSGQIVAETMVAAFEKAGRVAPADAEIRALIGLSLPRMVATLAQGLPEAQVGRIVAEYRLLFAARMDRDGEVAPYPEAPAALDRLAAEGVALGVATGKSKRGLDRLIAAAGWEGRFATVQCADHHPSKPHPSMIRRALLETATGEERALMVGDSVYDMEMARAAGVAALGVAWGYNRPAALEAAGAARVLLSFEALVEDILERLA